MGRIKKHANKNEYLRTESGHWVRNFTKRGVPFEDINDLVREDEHFTLLKNEFRNGKARYPWFDSEDVYHRKAVIVSDGYRFAERHGLLAELPSDVKIIGVNGTLKRWNPENRRSLDYYVVNNPYGECLKYLPRRRNSWPKCYASTRTNADFLENYRGAKWRWAPTVGSFSGSESKETSHRIDDYRNAICAAIGLCWHWGVEKLVTFCCDDVFEEDYAGSTLLENGLRMYPQHQVVHDLIEASFHWLTSAEVDVRDCSSGPVYENAEYITESEVPLFFKED